ncbi:MAG: hypothetical protein QMA93_00675 [Acidimicrobiales bacterium]
MSDFDVRSYTVAMAEMLGIHLEPDEIDPVADQIERVGQLVSRLPRQVDDALTVAPRFRP